MTTFTKKEKMMLVSSREIEKMRERGGGKENIEGENDENVNIIKYINNNKKSVDLLIINPFVQQRFNLIDELHHVYMLSFNNAEI